MATSSSSRTATLPSTLTTTISSHTGAINAITFSSLGGTYILTGSSDRQIHLSRSEPAKRNSNGNNNNHTGSSSETATTTTPIQKYAAHGYAVLDIAVARDNQTFASVGGDRSVFLWDVQNNAGTVRRFGSNTSGGHTGRITCVAFGGESDSVLVSGSDDRSMRLWDVKSRDPKPLMVLDDAKDGISCLAIPENNPVEILAGSIDGRLRAYDIRMGACTVDVQPGPVTSLDLSADANSVLVGCLDGMIRLMDRADGSCLRTFPPPPGEHDHDLDHVDVNGYKNDSLRLRSCFAVDERLVLSGSEANGKVYAWDVLSGRSVGTVNVNTKTGKVVSVVKWRSASQAQARRGLLAAGGAEGIVRIYSDG
ncbi:hypothetical protein PV10_03997 [Exophiala mesophila]|uniref:Uncharacterized protein n=1 Tax=Exophiala mesophila TaxID=212818 RepID=A0A0D1XWW5_EXOME|nr:uncharacterized protein PV10_03997 [Exophiala mesophila]KIV92726.1 hypothetical protein PV10_03997 [Exophiala mesophila]